MDRTIIRDSYGYKHYEIIQSVNEAFVYDYCLRCFLKEEESREVIEGLKHDRIRVN